MLQKMVNQQQSFSGRTTFSPKYTDSIAELHSRISKPTTENVFEPHIDAAQLNTNVIGVQPTYYQTQLDPEVQRDSVERQQLAEMGPTLSTQHTTLEVMIKANRIVGMDHRRWEAERQAVESGSKTEATSLESRALHLLDQHLPALRCPAIPQYNEGITIANTKKQFGTEWPGSKAEELTMEGLLKEYIPWVEPLRQMMVIQQHHISTTLDDLMAVLTDAELEPLRRKLQFVRDATKSSAGYFKMLMMYLPQLVTSRILPEPTNKEERVAASSLVGPRHLQQQQYQAEMVKMQQTVKMRVSPGSAQSGGASSTTNAPPKSTTSAGPGIRSKQPFTKRKRSRRQKKSQPKRGGQEHKNDGSSTVDHKKRRVDGTGGTKPNKKGKKPSKDKSDGNAVEKKKPKN